ncbi:BON domain-containing protein [Ensifer sp. NBAIM29]|nr:BON domain-containing protein [Ensifer sp. NBAIM29]
MASRHEWRRNDPERRHRRDWYGTPSDEERRRARRFEETGARGADWENAEYYPDAEPGRAARYRGWGQDYEARDRERAFRDYYGPGFGARGGYYPSGDYYPDYGYARRYPYRDYDRDRDYGERGFMERASDEVASWFGDEDAERRRRMDEYRGKGPKGYTRSDSRIQEDVSDRLSDDGALDASDIEVSVSNGEVQLSGFVNSKWAKRRAEDCAEDVSGVTNVQNNIRVRAESSSEWSSAESET